MQVAAKALDRYTEPLSVRTRVTVTPRRVVGDGRALCSNRRAAGFTRARLREADPDVVVDGRMHAFPTGTVHAVAPIAGDAVAWPHDQAELLDVQVQQIARRGVFIALERYR